MMDIYCMYSVNFYNKITNMLQFM